MSVSRSELREKIMTILYQIEMYNKSKFEYKVEDIIRENINISSILEEYESFDFTDL